jgi:hypothetical protein
MGTTKLELYKKLLKIICYLHTFTSMPQHRDIQMGSFPDKGNKYSLKGMRFLLYGGRNIFKL